MNCVGNVENEIAIKCKVQFNLIVKVWELVVMACVG